MRGGIFVGGRGERMGGIAKGLLAGADGEPLVLRAARLLRAVGVAPVLVGAHEAYRDLGLPLLADDPAASGPLGGLLALLAGGDALAIACDMPAFTDAALRLLLAAPPAPIVAPRRRYWEPLFARYSGVVLPVARAYAARGERRLQRLLDEAGAVAVDLGADADAWLADWDAPADMPSLLSPVLREKDRG